MYIIAQDKYHTYASYDKLLEFVRKGGRERELEGDSTRHLQNNKSSICMEYELQLQLFLLLFYFTRKIKFSLSLRPDEGYNCMHI